MTDWNAFYQTSEKRGPSPLLSRAMSLIDNRPGVHQAVDLGCGAGNEARQLMEAGWRVLAIDREPEAIARTHANCSATGTGMLTTWLADFEQLPELPPSSLIHAGLALPFCHPDRFQRLWTQVLTALKPGGVFVGHLFGIRHGWATLAHLTFHCEQEILTMCEGLDVALLRETETVRDTTSGSVNWHRFDLILRRQ